MEKRWRLHQFSTTSNPYRTKLLKIHHQPKTKAKHLFGQILHHANHHSKCAGISEITSYEALPASSESAKIPIKTFHRTPSGSGEVIVEVLLLRTSGASSSTSGTSRLDVVNEATSTSTSGSGSAVKCEYS